jgi:alkaline phosphatase D
MRVSFLVSACVLSTHCFALGPAALGTRGGEAPRYDERIVLTSCNHQYRESVWDVVRSKNASQAILLGDNVYADTKTQFGFIPATPEALARSYCILNGDPAWRRFVKSIGGYDNIIATLDDHDMGMNNIDSKYIHKAESMKCFLDFLRVEPESPRRIRSGVYSSVIKNLVLKSGAVFKYKIVLLDTRYNYVKPGDKDQEPDFLGEEQWAWLSGEINDPEPDLVLLGSGIMMLPTDKIIEETWHSQPSSRNRLLNMITHAANPNIVLLSGDVHSAEASEVIIIESGCSESTTVYPEV